MFRSFTRLENQVTSDFFVLFKDATWEGLSIRLATSLLTRISTFLTKYPMRHRHFGFGHVFNK